LVKLTINKRKVIEFLAEKENKLARPLENDVRQLFEIIKSCSPFFNGQNLTHIARMNREQAEDLITVLKKDNIIVFSRFFEKEHEKMYPTYFRPYELTEYGKYLIKKYNI
jgi:putative ribosome biogenesis GTPase RsgA